MSKKIKPKNRCNEKNTTIDVKCGVFLDTPEGPIPMIHKLMQMNEKQKEAFAVSVGMILHLTGFEPSEYAVSMLLTPIPQLKE